MSLSYTVEKNFVDFKKEVETIVAAKLKKDWISVDWQDKTMVVAIDKGGKSSFRIDFAEQGSTLSITEGKRDVAFFHKPFISEFEKQIDQIFTDLGAKKA